MTRAIDTLLADIETGASLDDALALVGQSNNDELRRALAPHAAIKAITDWLKATPEVMAYDPDVKVTTSLAQARQDPGSIMALTGDEMLTWDPSLTKAVAVIVYEGGPDGWPIAGDYSNDWRGVSEAEFRGELDLGPIWVEALTHYALALYPVD